MPEATTYNGWANYETWAVSMWLDGNYDGEGTYRHALAIVHEAAQTGQVERTAAVTDVADALSELVEETITGTDGLAGDLLGAALSSVDWRELAVSWLDAIGFYSADELADWEQTATELGREHAVAAAALRGPLPDLSGEWADELTPEGLFRRYAKRPAESDADGDAVEALAGAYEAGAGAVLTSAQEAV